METEKSMIKLFIKIKINDIFLFQNSEDKKEIRKKYSVEVSIATAHKYSS